MARIGIRSGQPVWHGEMIWANCIGRPVLARTNDLGGLHWPTGMAQIGIESGQPCMAWRNDLGPLHWPTGMAQIDIKSGQPVWHGQMIWGNCIGRSVWHGGTICANCIGQPV